jgi:putative transposase
LKVYPIVFFDAIHYKVTSEGKVTNKAAYTCLALDITGRKDLLGLWVSEAEGSNFWLSVLTELKNRGVQDILIACVDGLKGFPEAINTVFPGTEIQLCIIHLIRNTLRYIASKDQKSFMKELRQVYSAATEEAALIALDNWKKTGVRNILYQSEPGDRTGLTLPRFSSIRMKSEKSFTLPMQLRLCTASSGRLQNREAFSQ